MSPFVRRHPRQSSWARRQPSGGGLIPNNSITREKLKMRKSLVALTALAFAGFAADANAANCGAGITPTVIPAGDITTNTAWSGVVVLQGPVFVKNGATLTIASGTVVRGQPRQASVLQGSTAGTPGTIIVTQNGRIVANANAADPIIMTTAAIDNNNDGIADDVDGNPNFKDPWTGLADTFLDDTCDTAPLAPLDKAGNSNVQLWGGLVILGNAPTNNADKVSGAAGYGTAQIEGLTIPGFPPADATYGGVLPHDNSGIVRFVSVRHAGDEIGLGNELNGVSLGGVGDGTIFENVEVYANFDDGIEWFGGTVNGKNLVVSYVGDDMFDLDEGYTGVNQFMFGIMPFFNENDTGAYGSASGDKAGEFDGDNYRPDNIALNDNVNTRINIDNTVVDPTPWPLSSFEMYNMTVMGTTPDGPQDFVPVSAAGTNRGLQFRNGAAGNVYNSIVVNTGGETGIEIDGGVGGAPGFNATQNVAAGLINLVCSTLDDGAALAGTSAPPTGELGAVANGNALSALIGGSATTSVNSVNPATFDLVNDDTTFDPTGDASGKLVASLKTAPINPRTVQGIGRPNAGCAAPRGAGLDASAVYRGAFSFSNPLWTNGWTALNQGGLLAN